MLRARIASQRQRGFQLFVKLGSPAGIRNRSAFSVSPRSSSFSSAAAGQVAARDPRYTEVYTSGEKGYNTFRIPSVIATSRGTLLAFAEARREGAGDAGDIDLVLKRSEDGGVSWSPLQVVGDNGPNTFGNPCPVVDRTTGTIWLLTTQNRGTDREKDIIAGTSQAGRSVAVLHSTDDGVTWSAPVDITASVKQADWTWYATGPGVGIQTRTGRLVIPGKPRRLGHGHPSFTRRVQRRRRPQLADRRQRRRRAPTRARSSSWPTAG